MIIFGELLVCGLLWPAKKDRFGLFAPFGKKAIEFYKYLRCDKLL